jgi:hypothetical protein
MREYDHVRAPDQWEGLDKRGQSTPLSLGIRNRHFRGMGQLLSRQVGRIGVRMASVECKIGDRRQQWSSIVHSPCLELGWRRSWELYRD